jgi:hypothetical protein
VLQRPTQLLLSILDGSGSDPLYGSPPDVRQADGRIGGRGEEGELTENYRRYVGGNSFVTY